MVQLLAMLLVGGGLALLVVGLLGRASTSARSSSRHPRPALGRSATSTSRPPSSSTRPRRDTIGVAGRLIEQVGEGPCSRCSSGPVSRSGPGEFVLFVVSGGLVLGSFITAITESLAFGFAAVIASPFLGIAYLNRRIKPRKRKFEEQFPDAADRLVAVGRPHLPAAIQLMCEEAEPPISRSSRVVSETQLGDPLVDALERMAQRLDVRDVDWVVQAIRIQQTVGGKLADLHTLADFIRARRRSGGSTCSPPRARCRPTCSAACRSSSPSSSR